MWKERVLLHLGWMDIDYAIRKDEPPTVTDTSIEAEIALYEHWERSNRLSVMFIKTKISAGIRGSVDQHTKVRDLLKAIDKQFVTSDKALASTLIMKFCCTRLDTVRSVREHIMKMRDTAAQLKKLEVEISNSFLVHYILNTLPPQYSPFKISYNTHKDKWSINELMTMCVQEEGRLTMEMGESAMLAMQGKNKPQANKKGKGKEKLAPQADIKKDPVCFFCKKKGHVKKDCPKFQKWLEKKGNQLSLACYESNMVDVVYNTWWIDSGSTIHNSNSLQDKSSTSYVGLVVVVIEFVDTEGDDDQYVLWFPFPEDKPSNVLLLDEEQTSLYRKWNNSWLLLGTTQNSRLPVFLLATKPALIAYPDASASSSNGFCKLGRVSTGASLIFLFNR
ncbi:hypothetical protein F0562_003203 [Nyssa sinensis]|uniref:CCHC-type domain-containing protein n=1 Tax=Nyssa sinensis TaxID=561372 RepID=A0A5J5BVV6_9ASTE|nr:hypothetical protein F0562_003203 [Nyssa sinensis]